VTAFLVQIIITLVCLFLLLQLDLIQELLHRAIG
jgi:hypothetical protein